MHWVKRSVIACVLVFTATEALAQGGEIAGVVTDTTGAVVPGVTVEAASPALIEKVRSVVTDGQGQYRVIDLRPGTYTVTFTLPGFATVRREGIELSAGFSAPVNIEMKVGELDETITVSGASPIIDTQSVTEREVIRREVIEALPTPKSWPTIGSTVPGVIMTGQPDVGGSRALSTGSLSIHGGGVVRIQANGFNQGSVGASTAINTNDAALEEISYETSAISVEEGSGGIRVNLIPKEGGNRFSGSAFANYAGRGMQSNNFSSELKSRGLPAQDRVDKIPDESVSLGGPIVRDRLWFFFAHRYGGRWLSLGDIYFSKDPNAWVYNPDFSRPAIQDTWDLDNQLRLTWQATPKNKIGVFYDHHPRCHCHNLSAANIAAEAGSKQGTPHLYTTHATWTAPITSRLLIDVGSSVYSGGWTSEPSDGFTKSSPSWTDYSVLELSTGRRLVAPAPPFSQSGVYNWHTRAVVNYVTGSHALKGGLTLIRGRDRSYSYSPTNDTSLRLLNGVPQSIVVLTTPYTTEQVMNAGLALFGQEKWTIKRLTMGFGLRFDYLNWQVNAQSAPGGRWIGPRSFDPVYDVPNWKDLSPRVGVSYDLFGTGKTALKASASRYLSLEAVGITSPVASAVNPIRSTVNMATRTWTDLNSDRLPQENELGPLSNANFGEVVVRTRYDDAVREGWFNRPSEWEYSVSLEQQLGARISGQVGYYRRTKGHFTVSDNLAVTPADYDHYCITAPTDSRLPGGGGFQVCGLYDINPAKQGQENNLITFNDKETSVYDGVDFSMNARLPDVYFSGGVSIGQTATENCAVIDSPQQRFCKTSTGWQPIVNLSGSYTLPWWDISTGATVISWPGPGITATYNVPSAQLAPSLGRPLAAGARATVPVALVEPGTLYGDRRNQLDLRVSKRFRLGGAREFEVMADLYNALNASPVWSYNNTFGPEWQRPLGVLLARIAKVGAQFKF